MTTGRRRRRQKTTMEEARAATGLPDHILQPLMTQLTLEEVKLAQVLGFINGWNSDMIDLGAINVSLAEYQARSRLLARGQKALNDWWWNHQARRRMAMVNSLRKKEGEA